jgi:hypothetical protein
MMSVIDLDPITLPVIGGIAVGVTGLAFMVVGVWMAWRADKSGVWVAWHAGKSNELMKLDLGLGRLGRITASGRDLMLILLLGIILLLIGLVCVVWGGLSIATHAADSQPAGARNPEPTPGPTDTPTPMPPAPAEPEGMPVKLTDAEVALLRQIPDREATVVGKLKRKDPPVEATCRTRGPGKQRTLHWLRVENPKDASTAFLAEYLTDVQETTDRPDWCWTSKSSANGANIRSEPRYAEDDANRLGALSEGERVVLRCWTEGPGDDQGPEIIRWLWIEEDLPSTEHPAGYVSEGYVGSPPPGLPRCEFQTPEESATLSMTRSG